MISVSGSDLSTLKQPRLHRKRWTRHKIRSSEIGRSLFSKAKRQPRRNDRHPQGKVNYQTRLKSPAFGDIHGHSGWQRPTEEKVMFRRWYARTDQIHNLVDILPVVFLWNDSSASNFRCYQSQIFFNKNLRFVASLATRRRLWWRISCIGKSSKNYTNSMRIHNPYCHLSFFSLALTSFWSFYR